MLLSLGLNSLPGSCEKAQARMNEWEFYFSFYSFVNDVKSLSFLFTFWSSQVVLVNFDSVHIFFIRFPWYPVPSTICIKSRYLNYICKKKPQRSSNRYIETVVHRMQLRLGFSIMIKLVSFLQNIFYELNKKCSAKHLIGNFRWFSDTFESYIFLIRFLQ